MSNFHAQYKEYYNKISNNNVKDYDAIGGPKRIAHKNSYGRTILKRIIIQSYICTIMLMLVLVIKVVDIDFTHDVDMYLSKRLLSTDIYKYKNEISIKNIEKIQERFIDKVDSIISSITKKKSILNTISDEFRFPNSEKVVYANKKTTNDYMVFGDLSNKSVFSTYEGTVKDIGEDHNGGYIIISHGNGLETVYSMLERVYVSKGERIIREDYIGDCKKEDVGSKYNVGLKILYMGNLKDISYNLKNNGE